MSPGHAKSYFVEGLERADYYMADQSQEHQGKIKGKLARHLDLEGHATREVFFALCDNKDPKTGKPLTPITKENRLTGYDLNFHCPKSVSIVHALSQDDHIAQAFQSAVTETMEDIERDSMTRVRKGGIYADRKTGSLAWAEFIHETARPTKGHPPDMHLHCHCFVWNATYDAYERRIKAGKFRDIKRDMPYYQTMFQKRLADKLIDLGYRIRRTENAFEVVGVPDAALEYFSKRTNEIGQVAEKLGRNTAKGRNDLGALTRSAKQKGWTMKALKDHWRLQMRLLTGDKDSGKPIRFAPVKDLDKQNPEQAIQHALDHAFERASVMDERKILRAAYRHALGHQDVTIEDIDKAFYQDERFIRIKQGTRTLCTTKEALAEEKHMIELARRGQGKHAPLYGGVPRFDKLKDQQAAAATHVLTTRNTVSIVMGAAGTGKTTLMGEMRDKVEAVGKQVFAFAPTAEAARVLREEGFANADTVARVLTDKELQEKLAGQVILVDEAGMTGIKDMTGLLTLANKKNTRLILCGDTRQHASVVRGDALRVLNTVGGIQAAEVNKIRRQKNEDYRQAVEYLAKGMAKEGFEKLDGIGAIKAVDPIDLNTQLVDDYIATLKKGKTALIISPTHKQGNAVTMAIRLKLREAGLIGKEEITAAKLENLNLTEAEKRDARNFKEGQVVQFNQHVKGVKRGTTWTVRPNMGKGIHIQDRKGNVKSLPLDKAKNFDVYQKSEIGISKGDILRITRNGADEEKNRLTNGMALEVVSISKEGRVVLRNTVSKKTFLLNRDYGHISHAHVMTSIASQGKSVDEVFISQPASTFPATDLKNFYVSVSRGKLAVYVYTDDKEALLEHASEAGDRQSALELVGSRKNHDLAIERQQRETYAMPPRDKDLDKAHHMPHAEIDREYEQPRL